MSHAIDPFKQPSSLAAEDESDDEGAAAESLDDLAMATAAGGPRVWFRKLLPDWRARGLFVLAFLAVMAASIYWLVYTVQTKCE